MCIYFNCTDFTILSTNLFFLKHSKKHGRKYGSVFMYMIHKSCQCFYDFMQEFTCFTAKYKNLHNFYMHTKSAPTKIAKPKGKKKILIKKKGKRGTLTDV